MVRPPVPVRSVLCSIAAVLSLLAAGAVAPSVAVAAPVRSPGHSGRVAAAPVTDPPPVRDGSSPDVPADPVSRAGDAPAPGLPAHDTGPGTRSAASAGVPSAGVPASGVPASGVPAPAAASAVPVLRSTYDVKGGYVAAGVGMRNRGFGTINLTGIPAGGVVVKAFLYWTIFNPTEGATFKTGAVDAHAITGVRVGTGAEPCWDAGAGYGYRADVSALVTKNGADKLSRFASGQTDGASLVVVFQRRPRRRTRRPGCGCTTATRRPGPRPSRSMPSGVSGRAPRVADVRTTFIAADGQSAAEPGATINGKAVPAAGFDGTDPQAGAAYSGGDLWDTDTVRARKTVKPGNTVMTITVAGGPDCLVRVGQALSIGTNGAADTDGDRLLDGWEANGLDADGNGTVDVDLPSMGASVVRKDIDVEMDYMGAETTCPCRLPLAPDLARIVSVFATSPFANNPDGRTGIAIHLDAGAARARRNLGGGNLVADDPDLNPVASQFHAIKAENFASKRAEVFPYTIWADGYDGGTSSGMSFGIPSDSFTITLAAFPGGGSSNAKVGSFVHELGHGLGLHHGGDVDTNYKPNYLSVMSYAFQLDGIPRTGGQPADFGYSRTDLPSRAEGSLTRPPASAVPRPAPTGRRGCARAGR